MPDGFDIQVGFDAASLATIAKMAAFDGYFAMRMLGAGEATLEALQRESVDYMYATFKDPQGPLEDSLEPQMLTPWEGQLATNMPYARRREWGFSGRTDALGRYYPLDEGIAYFEHAIEAETDEIIGYYQTGINQTIADLGGVP